jgi:tetratricopeptide (TPR) repeat protein
VAEDTGPEPQAAVSTERSTKSPAYFRSIAEIGVQVARALDHAHEQGVIHRDVKPSNVILDAQGKPWITDFGLARIDSDATLTISGDLLGTVRYMSPEQALAKRIVVDHRTDVYSLGVTLYELLTLQPAFTGEDREQLLRQIAFEEPQAPRRLNKSVPAELETIVLKAMAKNPAERYDTAQELADDLERFLEDKPIRAKRPSLWQLAAKWSRRHRPVVVATVVSTTLVLAFAVALLAMSNVVIREQRDEKETALSALAGALKDRDDALEEANINLQAAETQRQRAESNYRLAMDALDTVYFEAIGQDRMLGETIGTARSLSGREKRLLRMGLDFYRQIADQNPESPAAGFEVATALVRLGLLHADLEENEQAERAFREAIVRCSKLIELKPNDPELWRERGHAYVGLGQWDKAIADYTKAIELNPDNPRAWLVRALYYFRHMRKHSLAIKDCDEAIRLDPNLATAYEHRAWSYAQGGDYHQTIADANEAIRLSPDSASAYHIRGLANTFLGDLEEAISDLTRAIYLDPKRFWCYRNRASCYQAKGAYEEAIADLTAALELEPEGHWDYFGLAALRVQMGDIEGYRQVSGEMLERFGESDDFHVASRTAWSCLLVPDGVSTEDLLAKLSRQAETEGEDQFGMSLYLSVRGLADYRKGQFAEAIRSVRKSQELNAQRPHKWLEAFGSLTLAMAQHRLGQHEEARRVLADAPQTMRGPSPAREIGGFWHDRLRCHLMRREAEELIENDEQRSGAGDQGSTNPGP